MSNKPKEVKAEELKKGFLPLYSKFYLKKKSTYNPHKLLLWFFLGIPFMALFIDEFQGTDQAVFIVFFGAIILYYFVIREIWLKYVKDLGTDLQVGMAVKKLPFGRERSILYSVLEEEIKAGYMKYGDYGIEIGKGKNKLVFHYEVGSTKKQKHIAETYEHLQQYIHTPLLPYDKKWIGLMDARYFYRQSNKNQRTCLLVNMILMLAFTLDAAPSEMGETMILLSMCCIWQCVSFYLLFRNAKKLAQKYDILSEVLKDYPYAYKEKRYEGYLFCAVVMIVALLVNGLIFMGI